MYSLLKNVEFIKAYATKIEQKISPRVKEIDALSDFNQFKVLRAFQEAGVSDYHFAESTGYGYDDAGRDALETVYAKVFGAQSALVRPQIASGTHAIAICLFGLLRPGDELMYITGAPYDTLEEVIGARGDGQGSLKDYQVDYSAIPLREDGKVDFERVKKTMTNRTKVIGIQRSKGYADRPSFRVEEIKEMVRVVKQINPNVIVFVDNCYGEFTEQLEPTEVGVDIMAGSLIKNPGGGIAKSGGYIVGKKEYVQLSSYRMTAPGIGGEVGATLYSPRETFQGLFLAPHVVGEALKGAVFAAGLFEELGFKTEPKWNDPRADLIQMIEFGSPERLIAFCQGIQKASPVDSFVQPEPSPMPGYADPVIMAGGTFIQGSSIELSADGPIREPYLGFMQGGLTYSHVKIGVLTALDRLLEAGLLNDID